MGWPRSDIDGGLSFSLKFDDHTSCLVFVLFDSHQ